MLNEEKIRLMTRLEVYEDGLGVGDERTAGYFRNDYILSGMVGSFVAGTIAWGICAAVYCGYFFEQIFYSVYENTLDTYLHLALRTYFIFIILFLLITFLIYYRRSAAFTTRRRMYGRDLEELMEICDQEARLTDPDAT